MKTSRTVSRVPFGVPPLRACTSTFRPRVTRAARQQVLASAAASVSVQHAEQSDVPNRDEQEVKVTAASKASLFTGVYALIAGVALIAFPIPVFGFLFNTEGVRQGWIQFGGILLSLIGMQYLGAGLVDRQHGVYSRGFYSASVWSRAYLVLACIVLVLFHEAPKTMLVLAAANLIGSLSMWLALRADDRSSLISRAKDGLLRDDQAKLALEPLKIKAVLLEKELAKAKSEHEALRADRQSAYQAVLSEEQAKLQLVARVAALEQELQAAQTHPGSGDDNGQHVTFDPSKAKAVLLQKELAQARSEQEYLIADRQTAYQAVLSEEQAKLHLGAQVSALQKEIEVYKARSEDMEYELQAAQIARATLQREHVSQAETINELQGALQLADGQLEAALGKINDLRQRLGDQEKYITSLSQRLSSQLASLEQATKM